MRRLIPLLALTGALLALTAGPAMANGYCSPTGDYCMSAAKKKGAVRISLATFSFRGRVRVCVTAPDGAKACKRFELELRRPDADVYSFDVRWDRYFPDGGAGRYRVRFSQQGNRIGRVLRFTV